MLLHSIQEDYGKLCSSGIEFIFSRNFKILSLIHLVEEKYLLIEEELFTLLEKIFGEKL